MAILVLYCLLSEENHLYIYLLFLANNASSKKCYACDRDFINRKQCLEQCKQHKITFICSGANSYWKSSMHKHLNANQHESGHVQIYKLDELFLRMEGSSERTYQPLPQTDHTKIIRPETSVLKIAPPGGQTGCGMYCQIPQATPRCNPVTSTYLCSTPPIQTEQHDTES